MKLLVIANQQYQVVKNFWWHHKLFRILFHTTITTTTKVDLPMSKIPFTNTISTCNTEDSVADDHLKSLAFKKKLILSFRILQDDAILKNCPDVQNGKLKTIECLKTSACFHLINASKETSRVPNFDATGAKKLEKVRRNSSLLLLLICHRRVTTVDRQLSVSYSVVPF